MVLIRRIRRSIIAAAGLAVWVLPGCSDGGTGGRGSTGGLSGKAASGGSNPIGGGGSGAGVSTSGGSSQIGGGGSGAGMTASGGSATGGSSGAGSGGVSGEGASGGSSQIGGGGSGAGMSASSGSASGGSATCGSSAEASGGAGGAAAGLPGFTVLTDTNRDGAIDDKDTAGLTDWALKGRGAFFIANTDDDDRKGKVDASDKVVNGQSDASDLARILINVSPELLAKAARVSVSVATGAERIHLFEKTESGWTLVNGALSKVGARVELGVEATQFADDQNGKAKMYIASPAAANAVLGSGFDAGNQQLQRYIDDTIAIAKTELGLSNSDILLLPTFFEGSGSDWAPKWSSPANAVYINGTLVIGDTNTPDKVKTDIEHKLSAIGVDVAWVNDSEYNPFGGNVHCGTNTAKTPICLQFAACLP
jgi:hypothetical protein